MFSWYKIKCNNSLIKEDLSLINVHHNIFTSEEELHNKGYINDIVDQEKFFAVFAANTPGFSIFSIGIEKNQEIKIEKS